MSPPRLALPRWLGAALILIAGVACKPSRDAGLYSEHPGGWGGDLIAIHHATFSDRNRKLRIATAPLHDRGLVANLEYPTSGRANRDIEALIDEHVAFVRAYLHAHPEARVTFAGFSQGGCVELDLLARLAEREPALLDRGAALLVAPARAVKLGRHTAVAKGMIARCQRAEAKLAAAALAEPEGPVARLLAERTWIAWACRDGIVGHDSFTDLREQIPAEHRLYRRRFGHMNWVGKAVENQGEGSYGAAIPLATGLLLALAGHEDPREALAPYGGFDPSC